MTTPGGERQTEAVSGDDPATTPPPRGRPRSRHVDARILDALYGELMDGPYAAMTVDGVARRAGVARTTIYRRYGSKVGLVSAVLMDDGAEDPVPPRSDDPLGDVRVFLARAVAFFVDNPRRATVWQRLLAEASFDPEVADLVQGLRLPARDTLCELFHAARHCGQLPEDYDVEIAVDMLFAVVPLRVLISRAPLTYDLGDRMIDTLLPTGHEAPARLTLGAT